MIGELVLILSLSKVDKPTLGGPGLRLEIENRTDIEKTFYTGPLCPSTLIIYDEQGNLLPPNQSRSIKDSSPPNLQESDFKTLPPGQRKLIHSSSFNKLSETSDLELWWDGQVFSGLKPGPYQVMAKWSCQKDLLSNMKKGSSLSPGKHWIGDLASRFIHLQVHD